jgi:hypothetical protein
VEILVEERSAELALEVLVPKIIPGIPFKFRRFQGKPDLLKRLPGLLKGYASTIKWDPLRIVILVDRDTDDCRELRGKLLCFVKDAGLPTDAVLPRIAIDELESWFMGDVPALRAAYPRVPAALGKQAGYRDPDGTGKASRALEKVLRSSGDHRDRLGKVRAAEEIAPHMDVENNNSKSFQVFRDGLRRLVNEGKNA